MTSLGDLGADTPTGVPYTEEQILVMVIKDKQQGHIPGVGRQGGSGCGEGVDDHEGEDEDVGGDDDEGH
nr:hypothetical protein [Tanacetum cinerariifolium]